MQVNAGHLGELDTVDDRVAERVLVTFRWEADREAICLFVRPSDGTVQCAGGALPPTHGGLVAFAEAWKRCRKFIESNGLVEVEEVPE